LRREHVFERGIAVWRLGCLNRGALTPSLLFALDETTQREKADKKKQKNALRGGTIVD
jgi:hypothetical protein